MADEQHGIIVAGDGPAGDRGVHTSEGRPEVVDEAARAALVQISADRGRIVFQSAGLIPGWYMLDGVTGETSLVATLRGGLPLPERFILDLIYSPNAGAPTSQIDIGPGSARSDDNTTNIVSTGTLTADIAIVGANGRDAGAEAANTWYSVWVIDDSTEVNPVASLLSTSATAPTLPVGYDVKRRVGWVRNDAGSNFIPFSIVGIGGIRAIRYDTVSESVVNVLSGGSASSFADVDLSGLVPPTVQGVDLLMSHEGSALVDGVRVRTDGETVADPATQMRSGASTGTSVSSMEFRKRCSAAQIIEYENFTAGESTDLWVLGYADSLF